MLPSWTALATPFSPDTVGLDTPYCQPSWKVRQIFAITQAAQDLVAEQAVALQVAGSTIAAADSTIAIQKLRLINVLGQAANYKEQVEVQADLTAIQKKKTRRRGWLIVGIVTAWVVIEVAQSD